MPAVREAMVAQQREIGRNGKVIMIGGNTSGQKFSDSGAILATEIWNPGTGLWREGAAMAVPRNYHSIALLMTDGRVLAAGGGYCYGNSQKTR